MNFAAIRGILTISLGFTRLDNGDEGSMSICLSWIKLGFVMLVACAAAVEDVDDDEEEDDVLIWFICLFGFEKFECACVGLLCWAFETSLRVKLRIWACSIWMIWICT